MSFKNIFYGQMCFRFYKFFYFASTFKDYSVAREIYIIKLF